ncbi:MarR family winged helix-turn-helix transcriptional regulator [Bacillus alkalicellulosilyticus]|uniref:MarR family winged helix-turn-helix transcriptional regulator n=1 Tax=Alkalihalobacterium alkalicellulosilyticum TaxID=1912214 RepID=UPI0009972FA8|nr:MarR family transcriptional regulator [Bacillus alkalicellulosilyticus]
MDKDTLYRYIERLDNSFYRMMKELGPKIVEQMEIGLTPEQLYVLNLLSKNEKITSSHLANELNVKPSAITAMVDRLVKHEYVERLRDDKDRRVVYIALSEQGKEILVKSENKRNEIMEKYVTQLEEIELEQLVVVFEKLTTIIIKTEGEKSE